MDSGRLTSKAALPVMKTVFLIALPFIGFVLTPARAGTGIAPVAIGDAMGYRAAVVTKVEGDGLRVRHEGGMAKVPIERVPEEMRARFGLTVERAEAHRAEKKAGEEERRRWRALVEEEARLLGPVTFRVCEPVVRVMDDGVLVDGFGYTDGERVEVRCYERVRISGPTTLSPGRPVISGCRLAGTRWEALRKFMDGPVFIETEAGGIADGDLLDATLYRSGTRAVTTPEGAVLTLKRFVTDRAVAFAELRDGGTPR
jgi:hypothetical protein